MPTMVNVTRRGSRAEVKDADADAKASQVSQLPKTMSDPFVFVPITQSEAAKGRGAAKRIVRAHVTRVQHAKSSSSKGYYDLQSWTVNPYNHHATSLPIRRKLRPDGSSEKHRRQTSAKHSARQSSSPEDDGLPIEPPEMAVVLPKLPAGGFHTDPFWTYPVEYQPELPPIFAHYIQHVAVEIPDVDGPDGKGLLRRVWFPMCMTDPAPMYAVLLMAASHYCAVNPAQAKVVDLLALKSRALSEVNAALADPSRATSDSIIGAVGKLAAYEAIFGDSEVFHAHMKGLQLMLRMRGAPKALGLNGLLERMLVWIDLNAVHLIGGERIFGGETGIVTEVEFDGPDPYHFAGIQ